MKLQLYPAAALAAGLLLASGARAQRADPAAADSAVPATRYVAELAPAASITPPPPPPPQQWRALNRLVASDAAMAPVADEKTLPAPAPTDPHAHTGHHHPGAK
jgi:hypothetical protein